MEWIIALPDTTGTYYFGAPGFVTGTLENAAGFRHRESHAATLAMQAALIEARTWKMSGRPYWTRR